MTDVWTPDELGQVFSEEDHKVEFKRYEKISKSEEMAKEMVALANREGGYLVIGVTDDVQLEGVKIDEDKAVGQISNISRMCCDPPVAFEHSCYYDLTDVNQTGDILVINIQARDGPPHSIVSGDGSPERKYYLRTGNQSRPILNSQELEQLFLSDVDPDFSNRYETGFCLERSDLGLPNTYPDFATNSLLSSFWRLIDSSTKDEFQDELVAESIGSLEYFRSEGESPPALTRCIRELAPFLIYSNLEYWNPELDTLTYNVDSENRFHQTGFSLLSFSDYKLDHKFEMLSQIGFGQKQIEEFFQGPANIIVPTGTTVTLQYHKEENSTGPPSIIFEKENCFRVSVKFDHPPKNTIQKGLPAAFPGYLKDSEEDDVLFFRLPYTVKARFDYPDEPDRDIRKHIEFAEKLEDRVAALDLSKIFEHTPHPHIYDLHEKVDDLS